MSDEQKPIFYQYRTRPITDDKYPWSAWRECQEKEYKYYLNVPVLHNWAYEVRALHTHPAPYVDTEPNWKHFKIQALIASDARSKIAIHLISQLIEDPECELTPLDMEYWGSIHEALKKRLISPASDAMRQPLTEERIMDMYCEPCSDREMIEFARAIEKAHGIGGSDE